MRNNKESESSQIDPSADILKPKDQPIKDQPIKDQSDQQTKLSEQGGFENTVEPTRFGDWEIAGRCVDF